MVLMGQIDILGSAERERERENHILTTWLLRQVKDKKENWILNNDVFDCQLNGLNGPNRYIRLS
jgi:hypothetical protein